MLLLIKNARCITAEGELPTRQDILIRDGVIEKMGAGLAAEPGATVWDFPNACVSPGWFDLGIQACDPGFEHREDLRSAARAAAAGGFTAVANFPNTQPALHGKSEVLYVRNKTAGEAVHFHPVGAISEDAAGKDLAELYDMHAAGAVAFSDGAKPVQDAGLLLRALQYCQAFDGLVINHPHHKTIAHGGQMHEGLVSTSLGMKGIPALAEEIMLQRDLSLLEYAGGRLMVHLVSTKKSVDMLRRAKAAGLQVTASVALLNLCFTDEQMSGAQAFDSNWKVLPPLRSAADRAALREGLADGAIDLVCTNHNPWDEEAKNLEFPYAEFGMLGLQTAFPLWQNYLGDQFSLSDFVRVFADTPRQVLGLPVPELREGAPAELTVFDPDASYTLTEGGILSKSKNSPFIGQALRGRVLGIVGKGQGLLTSR